MVMSVQPFSFDPTIVAISQGLNALLFSSIFNKFDPETANHAIEKGADINFIDTKGNTILHRVVLADERLENYNAIIKFLSQNNADISAKDSNYLTPFQLAAKKGFVKVAQSLLENFSSERDLLNNSTTNDNKTPLMLACEADKKNMVDFLLEKKADVEKKDLFGESAIFFACSKQVIEKLIKSGFTIDDTNSHDFTPLKKAVKDQRADLTEILLACGAEINVFSDRSNENILMYALKKCRIDVLKKLLAKSKKEHIIQKDKFGNNLLHLAIVPNSYDKLKLLLQIEDIKQLINEKNDDGNTPLNYSILSDYSLIKLLIDNGADVTLEDKNNLAPIEKSLNAQSIYTIDLILLQLIQKNCLQKLPNFFKSLHEKSPVTKKPILNLLLHFKTDRDDSIFHVLAKLDKDSINFFFQDLNNEHIGGYSLENKNKDDKTPLEIAIESDKQGCVIDSLIENGAKPNEIEFDAYGYTPLIKAVKEGNESLARILAQHFDVNNANPESKWTALNYAANLGHHNILQYLLNKEAKDSCSFTAIMSAAISNQTECLETLLKIPDFKKRIDVQYKNKTALMYAAKYNHLEAIKILVENGALLHVKDEKNHTAMDLATIEGHKEIVSYLCDIDIQYYSTYSSKLKLTDPLQYAKKTLFLAVEHEKEDIIQLLVNEKNVSVNCWTNDYETPLHRACILAKSSMVKVLLQLRADINAEMKKQNLTSWFYQGKTPLMCAVERANHRTVEVLINDENCKINLENIYHDNWTALDYALAFKKVSSDDSEIHTIVTSLQEKGARTHL